MTKSKSTTEPNKPKVHKKELNTSKKVPKKEKRKNFHQRECLGIVKNY